MPAQSPPNDDLRRFSDVLEDLGHAPAPKLSMAELVASFGERGFGAMILILSLLALLPWPPGGKAVFAIPIILMSLELAFQRRSVWLPRWMLQASVSRAAYNALIATPFAAPAWLRRWVLSFEVRIIRHRYIFANRVRRVVRRRPNGPSVLRLVRAIEKLTRPRLPFLTGDIADTFTGLVCVVLALIMALPIPFGDALPGIALVLFALGMMQRDGVAILLGMVATAASALYLFLIWATVVEVGHHIAGWFARLLH
jgi:hypothetical protein